MSRLLSKPTTILLTGGTSGIGLELVRMLLDEGHAVIVLARRASGLADALGVAKGLTGYDCDLADVPALRRAMEQIANAHTDISVIVNNAGFQYAVPFTAPEFDAAMMERELAINLLAPALIIHHLLGTLLAHGRDGAIVNVSSGLAFFPKRQSALYCATKAALHSLSQSLRYQLQDTAVDVIEAILPLVDTPMTAGRGSGKMRAEDAARAILVGVKRRDPEIYVGKARLIPLLMRVAPSLGRRILRGT